MELWLIRHGETDWNVARRFQGSADRPLNDLGQEQARALAPALQDVHFDAVYASPLTRVIETAQGAGLKHRIVLDARLREIGFGVFEGLTFAEIEQKHPKLYAEWIKDRSQNPHGGDTLQMVVDRAESFRDDLLKQHQNETVLVFGHGGTNSILMCLLMRFPPNRWWQFLMQNTSVTVLKTVTDGTLLIRFNDIHHFTHIT